MFLAIGCWLMMPPVPMPAAEPYAVVLLLLLLLLPVTSW